ncbi:MAG: exodeoxyribonuclease VII small subunit [Flavobacteriales bacterium]|nr:exodeoxyribonuclease VII small subunit [Flavobacteriales bacterium]
MTYQKAYDELEAIMQDLQADKISVDEMTAKVKRAVELIDFCNTMLRTTEGEVSAIVKKLGLG